MVLVGGLGALEAPVGAVARDPRGTNAPSIGACWLQRGLRKARADRFCIPLPPVGYRLRDERRET